VEKATSALPAGPSLGCVHPLLKLLKFRSQLGELEDLSAENGPTVTTITHTYPQDTMQKVPPRPCPGRVKAM